MDQELCKLTLVYPIDAEDRVLELLLESQPPLGGFATWRAEGHGQDFTHASVAERVRGRVSRGMLVMVQERNRIDRLLSEIGSVAPIAHLAYWLEPVLEFGRMRAIAQHSGPTDTGP
ncbi:MAG: DUF3240 family protein [Hyphomicrobiaceae bacterium]